MGTNYYYLSNMYSKKEIADMIDSRLLSNGYGNFMFANYNKEGQVTLKCDKCDNSIFTTIQDIEDGTLSSSCPHCKDKEINRQIIHQNEISKTIRKCDLELIRIEENDYTVENYIIKCKKCGKEYYLNEDFYLDSIPDFMCCKNWECMIDLLRKNNNWFAEKIDRDIIKFIDNDYVSEKFVMDYEDWLDNLQYHDGIYTEKCDKCGVITVKSFEHIYDDCDSCCYNNDTIQITMWDKVSDKVHIKCLKCGSEYYINEKQAYEEVFECFNCYRISNENQTICPICDTKQKKKSRFCNTCGYCLDVVENNIIKNQQEYTNWMLYAVYPSMAMWGNANSKITELKETIVEYQSKITTLENETSQVKNLKQILSSLLDK